MKKNLAGLLLLAFIIMVGLSGCAGSSGQTKPKMKAIPSDTEVLKEVSKGKVDSTVTKEDEDMTELKHLKYAKPVAGNASTDKAQIAGVEQQAQALSAASVEPTTPVAPVALPATVEDGAKYSIHFLSEEEAKLINQKLVKLGYLKQPAANEGEFVKAVVAFQQAEKISCTGQINPETFARLRQQ